MRKWHCYGVGIVSGLVLAASFGFVRSGAERADSAGTSDSAAAAAAEQADPQPPLPADGKLRIIAFGAHPDDCEGYAGGTACLWSDLGHHVKFVSVTNGDIGHWRMAGGPLARRRLGEVRQSAKILGTTTEVLDIHDGELEPTLENRRTITRLIRGWDADVVIAHRPNDYHPDHRYTGVLVQDSAYMVTVPFFCPLAPALKKNPVFLYAADDFQKPNPFRADVAVAIDRVIERRLDALAVIDSQFVEGGVEGNPGMVPKNKEELKAARQRVREDFRKLYRDAANRFRDKLVELYGPEDGKKVRYAEAFEICEYGRRPTPDELRKLFPFLPERK